LRLTTRVIYFRLSNGINFAQHTDKLHFSLPTSFIFLRFISCRETARLRETVRFYSVQRLQGVSGTKEIDETQKIDITGLHPRSFASRFSPLGYFPSL
jgi:hypothetical protein